MRMRLDSLYLRLALVLVTALVAGFATMGWVFHSHVEENRLPGHGLGAQVRLIEALLKAQPDADISRVTGFSLFRGEMPPESFPIQPGDREAMPLLRLTAEMGRKAEARRIAAGPGLWIRLDHPTALWLFIAPPHRPAGLEPWTWGLLVTFGIILLGGMALLWRVQVPLRELERALARIHPGDKVEPLTLSGPREVVSLAEQFNQLMARLQDHEEDRNVMLAGVAHDLRAPITRLRLQLETGVSPGGRAAMERNLDSVEAIVNQFLLFARGGSGEALAEYDLGAFVAEVLAPYEDREVTLLPLDDDWMTCEIRADSLRRALCNLVDNALEYGKPPVTVRLGRRKQSIVIAVGDAGAGIPDDQRSRALRPFSRLDQARSDHGHCGLGLAIAAQVAEAHGGELILGQSPEGGLLAEIILPARIAGSNS